MNFEELTIETKKVFEGRVISLKVDTVKLPNGNISTREIIEHPGGVAILPVDSDGYTYLVSQYRKPIEKLLLEVPAGKLDIGEDHFECGIRELHEETGFKSNKVTYLGYIVPSPGYANEKIYLYLAQELTKYDQNLDEDEFLNVEKYKFNDVVKMCLNNEITDAKTLALVFKAKELFNK